MPLFGVIHKPLAVIGVRDKTDVQELPEGLDFISKLNPVKFRWRDP